jgi:hypothetical protein
MRGERIFTEEGIVVMKRVERKKKTTTQTRQQLTYRHHIQNYKNDRINIDKYC